MASILTLVPEAISQAPLWGQCGGQGFTGPTTCVGGCLLLRESVLFKLFPRKPPVSPIFIAAVAYHPHSEVAKSTEGSNTVATTLGGKLYFGTGVHNYELNDPAYAAKLNNVSLFGQITPASLSWDATEPVQGVFTFDEADALVALAKKNGQLIRAPPCISPSQVPNWVNTLENSPSALFDIITHHCITLVREPLCWGNVRVSLEIEIISLLDAWDIVVDPFTSEGFTAPVGVSVASGVDPSYIDDILTAARAADPAAKLYAWTPPGQALTSMLGEVQWLQEHGIPLDGVGFQSHFVIGSVPSKEALMANYQNFTALGLEVAVTVLDIRGGLLPDFSGQQQADYETVISACKAVPGCVGVTLADISDKYSDIPVQYSGAGSALPWDINYVATMAYDGIIAGFTN
ncbi:hypothetical protein MSAN_02215700 [Mycena sanguinolenta]|uniref:endo-1,4-beta-xylanase n=2 Tax=Mycena sanguinolenta TaxID=230812 RepID=A0A8H7CKQ9_9AGAR|nr:hypothetical protein MSAN_02215700 [Mycena sanguinolenta]